MNKQQLASKIWESANKMRSKIEANEYKDYILGFIFYKFLSEKEVSFLQQDYGMTDEDLKDLQEDEPLLVETCQNNLGFFISYENLFSTWIQKGRDFDSSDVTTALSAFNRMINPKYKKLFEKIFDTLETGINKLGDTSGARTKAINGLIQLIKDIPMDGKQDYDVLGFIYEYLISNFAANAGKKAGEFYTPHEVSVLMSEIVANHMRSVGNRNEIKIYDPTSGSGSLLITIGQSVARHCDNMPIHYYAQELKENTYNLTRMNLTMRGIAPERIFTRNADTLEKDWPLEDEDTNSFAPLYVDAVVSNPPYSQNWDTANKENDPRYKRFGVAPKGKADYAFLLHDLFHIKPDGIMTIVLPHGVLFRGGDEGKIRTNLIEHNHIDAIIGLPANIFFGTGIPTIIMVLRQKRENTDVLFVDASKNYIKEGKNNKLQASDIKRIVDAVANRADIPKFSRKVTLQEIRDNDYNLNIPRYVDSSEATESWDIYATMFGGIPKTEIALLDEYWSAFGQLRTSLFTDSDTPYCQLAIKSINDCVHNSPDVKGFLDHFSSEFNDFSDYLQTELIGKMQTLNVVSTESAISSNIFGRLSTLPLLDRYKAYQTLDDKWNSISSDLEIIQTEGFQAVKQVDPNMVIKKKKNEEVEVQEGWLGHVLPFELVQRIMLPEDVEEIRKKEQRLSDIAAEYSSIIESFSEEEKDGDYLNESNDAFVAAEVKKVLNTIFESLEDSAEINGLTEYLAQATTAAKLTFIQSHSEVNWSAMEQAKNGTYAKGKVTSRIQLLRKNRTFPEESFEGKMIRVDRLMSEEKDLKSAVKVLKDLLHKKTKQVIEELTDEKATELLYEKWIAPLVSSIFDMPAQILNQLIKKVEILAAKYTETYHDLETQIRASELELCGMLDELTGNEYDMKGLKEFRRLLKGEGDEQGKKDP